MRVTDIGMSGDQQPDPEWIELHGHEPTDAEYPGTPVSGPLDTIISNTMAYLIDEPEFYEWEN